MDLHKNARLAFANREELTRKVVLEKLTLNAAAAAFNVSRKTAAKWVRRYREQGSAGLYDRSSRPRRHPRGTPLDRLAQIESLRRQRWAGIRIAMTVGVSPATVSRVLRRLGISRMRQLDPPPPVQRYEHAAPGDLLHLDIKKIGRFGAVGIRFSGTHQRKVKNMGWEYLHVAVDDHSRIAGAELHPNQKAPSAARFLRSVVAQYAGLGIPIRRVLTDNGPCYRSHSFRRTCRELGIQQRFTRPYTPRTNGKAERFILTAMREWAWARAYDNSDLRAAELPNWLHQYNWHRPHASLNHQPPISRSGLDRNNVLTHHT
jgi:transposase InsO family protein